MFPKLIIFILIYFQFTSTICNQINMSEAMSFSQALLFIDLGVTFLSIELIKMDYLKIIPSYPLFQHKTNFIQRSFCIIPNMPDCHYIIGSLDIFTHQRKDEELSRKRSNTFPIDTDNFMLISFSVHHFALPFS